MGYYSSFEVVETDIPNFVEVINGLMEDEWHGCPGFVDNGLSYDCAKWYGWLTDLEILAKLYPDNYLVMERCGEESPDISRAVVKNGKVVEIHPEFVWPEVL